MDKASALNALSQFQEALRRQGVRDARLILFGSHARGRPREDSDIDVVVISERFAGKNHWERRWILADAVLASHCLIEGVALTPEEWDNEESSVVEFARDGIEVTA